MRSKVSPHSVAQGVSYAWHIDFMNTADIWDEWLAELGSAEAGGVLKVVAATPLELLPEYGI
jgi:hypothetical protein